eukprot:scaffold37188_cov29-Attheya_sp.AAC.4
MGTTGGFGRWARRRTGSLVGTTLGGGTGTGSSGSTIGSLGGLAWDSFGAVCCGACSICIWTGTLGGWTGGVGTDCAIFGRILGGLRRAWVRSWAARVAASADDIWGIRIV